MNTVVDATDDVAEGEIEDHEVTVTVLEPELTVTKSAGTTGDLQADGTFTQAFSVTLENTGNVDITAPSLLDNVETLFGAMYTPSTDAVTTSGVSAAPVVTADAANTGIAPLANANCS